MRANLKRPGLTWPSLITLGVLGALVVAGTPANAGSAGNSEGLCNARAKVLNTLEKDYGEKPVAFGIAANGSLVQLIAAQGGKTWTLVVHSPNGTSCLMAAGEVWRPRPPQARIVASRAGGPR